ncbi:MAG: hypothetical protein HY694_08090 [Deltaproteobacteria bacterium]|nr:hypothetical protein [Deltaproteobacteria bacterium]
MSKKTFAFTAGAIFALIALLHLLRIVFGWHAEIGGWEVPTWISWVAVIIAAYLGYEGIRLGKRP